MVFLFTLQRFGLQWCSEVHGYFLEEVSQRHERETRHTNNPEEKSVAEL